MSGASELERLRAENAQLREELRAERSVTVIDVDLGAETREDLGERRARAHRQRLELNQTAAALSG